ncbi:hypothetical protein LguiB_018178 [Lonicera macranthoides]
MMNLLALSLVLTSILTADIFTPTSPPNPDTQKRGDHVIVREGHRVLVVEFEKEGDGNIKVLIPPEERQNTLEEPPSSKQNEFKEGYASSGPRELICDAFGKCKHKIAVAIGKTKDRVVETAHQVSDKVYDAKEEAKDLVSEGVSKVKETATEEAKHAAHNVSNKVYDVKEGAKDIAHKVSDKVYDVKEEAKDVVGDRVSKVKETVTDKAKKAAHKVSDKVYDVKEGAKDTYRKASNKAYDAKEEAKDAVAEQVSKVKEMVADKAKDATTKMPSKEKGLAKDTVDMTKNLGLDIERNLTEKMEPITEKAKMAEEMAKADVNKAKENGEEEVNTIFRQVRAMLGGVGDYLVGPREAVEGALVVVHLLGFSVAYGTCVWVTFVSSYVLARAVPRQQFGVVQSKVYRVYFTAMMYSIGAALVAYLLSQRGRVWSSGVVVFQGWNLLGSVLMVLVNLLYLEPRATKVMFERMKLQKEEGRGGGMDSFNIAEPSSSRVEKYTADREPVKTTDTLEQAQVKSKIGRINERLKKMNSYSSLLNLATLMTLSWHLVYLAQRLRVAHRSISCIVMSD